MATSSSGDTVCMRIRLPWKENVALAWRASRAGTSVSTVTFELGTIIPMRWWLTGSPDAR